MRRETDPSAVVAAAVPRVRRERHLHIARRDARNEPGLDEDLGPVADPEDGLARVRHLGDRVDDRELRGDRARAHTVLEREAAGDDRRVEREELARRARPTEDLGGEPGGAADADRLPLAVRARQLEDRDALHRAPLASYAGNTDASPSDQTAKRSRRGRRAAPAAGDPAGAKPARVSVASAVVSPIGTASAPRARAIATTLGTSA